VGGWGAKDAKGANCYSPLARKAHCLAEMTAEMKWVDEPGASQQKKEESLTQVCLFPQNPMVPQCYQARNHPQCADLASGSAFVEQS